MAEVKHFIDQSSIQQDADFLKGQLDEILRKIELINKTRVTISGAKSFSDAGAATRELQKTQEELVRSTEKLAAVNAKLEKSREAQLKADTQQVKLDRERQKALSDLQKEKERVLRQQQKEVDNIDKLNNEYIQLNNRYKEASALSLKRGAELLKEAKGNNELFLSLLKTDKAYDENTRSAKELSAQLLLLEQNIGRSQRNVGNYAGSFNNLNRQFGLIANELPSLTVSINQFALALSNNLPLAAEEIRNAQREIAALKAEGKAAPSIFKVLGNALFSFQVGISIFVTVLVAFLPKIIDFFSRLRDGIPTLEDLGEETKKYTELLSEERTKLDLLFRSATNANAPLKARLEAVKKLRESYGAYLKDFTDEEILAGKAATAYDKLSEAIIKTSRARAAESLLQAKDLEILRNEEKIAKVREKAQKDAIAAQNEIQRRTSLSLRQRELLAPQESPQQIFKAARDVVATLRKTNDEIEKEKASLLNTILNNQVDPFTEDDKNGGRGRGASDRIKDFLAEERKAQQERIQLTLKDQAAALREIADNENQSFANRLEALKQFSLLSQNIAAQERDFELAELEKRRVKEGLTEDQVKQQRLLIIAKFNSAVVQNTQETNEAIVELQRENEEEIKAIDKRLNDARIKEVDDLFNARISKLEKQRDEEIKAAIDAATKLAEAEGSPVDLERLEAKKLEIKNKYNRLIIESEINKVRALAKLEPDPAKQAQLLARAAALELKLDEDVTNQKVESLRLLQQEERRLADLRQQLQQEVIRATEAATLGIFDREKNLIQDRIELLEERKRKEIELINATVTDEVEKAARITNAEKRAQVERERLEFRQRQLDIQRARFEQLFQLGQIAQRTAAAVADIKLRIAQAISFAALNPGALGAIPVMASQIPVAIGIGAAQAAAVLATPVPRFKTGKGDYDKYEGPAWVGDGGKAEMIFREDGTVEKTPSTPALTFVGKNDVIHPDADALIRSAMAQQNKAFTYQVPADYQFEQLSTTLTSELRNVAKEIRNKREWFVQMRPDGMSVRTKDGNRWKQYLNNNLQFGE